MSSLLESCTCCDDPGNSLPGQTHRRSIHLPTDASPSHSCPQSEDHLKPGTPTEECNSLRTATPREGKVVVEETLSFITILPPDVALTGIWQKVVAGHRTVAEKFKSIANFRSVCTQWRLWMESTAEYADYRESYVDHLLSEGWGRESGWWNM